MVSRLAKKRAKILQKVFEDEDFILKLLQDNQGIEEIKHSLSDVLKYYFVTMDKKHTLSVQDMMSKLDNEILYHGKDVVEQRYYFQAYNGASEKSYRENGLDDISGMDPEVLRAVELLEEHIGKTKNGLGGENGSLHKTFVTTDFEMLANYALFYSPERIWKGPLWQEKDKKTTCRIGESKSDFMMRIMEEKISKVPEEKQEELRKAARLVADTYGSRRPRIAIIPESEIAMYNADCNELSKKRSNAILLEYAEEENSNWTYDLKSGPNMAAGNGIVLYNKVTPDKFVSFSIPDLYELGQMYAIQRGAELGDLVNPENWDVVEKSKGMAMVAAQNEKGIWKRVKARLFGKTKSDELNQETVEQEKTSKEDNESKIYTDMGRVNLGGTGEMYICQDEQGNEYIFKPAFKKHTTIYEPFRADVQVAASKLQEIVSPDTAVVCELAEVGDMKGAIQPKIKVDDERVTAIKRYYYCDGELDESIAKQFMREYVVDFCLANYDSHYRNFIVDENGNLRGIDKEQSLRYIKDSAAREDYRFTDYHPNAVYGEQPPIYKKIFADIERGKISPEILNEVLEGVERVRSIPQEEYLKIFLPYAESLGYEGAQLEGFQKLLLDRVDSLTEVEKMVGDIKEKAKLPSLSALSAEHILLISKKSDFDQNHNQSHNHNQSQGVPGDEK